MTQIWIILIGLVVLGFIFLRKYLFIEKGITLKSYFFRKKNLFRHIVEPDKFEITVEEMIPSPDKVDPKKMAKADTYIKKADIFLGRGDLKGAEKLLIQAIALDPSSIPAYNKLGLIYLRQNQFRKAESIYRKLILTVLEEPVYFSNLGRALYSQGKLDEAKTFYKKALELDVTRAGRFFSLGQIFRELGEVEEALSHLRKAVEMEPRNLDYILSLAEFYLDRKMTGEAKQLVSEILLIAPDNEMALLLMDKIKELE